MEDRMEVGNLVPLKDGWFYDTSTDQTFHLDDDGFLVDENGEVIGKMESNEVVEDFWEDDEYRGYN